MRSTDLLFWTAAASTLAAVGRFVDYLLGVDLRKEERRKVQRFFGHLFDAINRTNFARLQLLVVDGVLSLIDRLQGRRVVIRTLLLSLLLSQYWTFAAFVLHHYLRWPSPIYWFKKGVILNLVPFAPYLGLYLLPSWGLRALLKEPVIWLEGIGFFWNNWLFDFATIAVTTWLLKWVQRKRKHFVAASAANLLASYVLAYSCIVVYLITPPNVTPPDFNLHNFIPVLWHRNSMLLFFGLTTFVPVGILMFALLVCSVAKGLQWVFATCAYDFAQDSEQSAFFKLSATLAASALVLKVLYEIASAAS